MSEWRTPLGRFCFGLFVGFLGGGVWLALVLR